MRVTGSRPSPVKQEKVPMFDTLTLYVKINVMYFGNTKIQSPFQCFTSDSFFGTLDMVSVTLMPASDAFVTQIQL